jgi:hypothetical protein
LIVVFLAIDIPAGMTQLLVELFAFFQNEVTVGSSKSFIDQNSGLLGFQTPRFGSSQFAASDSLVNSSLLAMLDSVDASGSSQCGRRTHSYSNEQTQYSFLHGTPPRFFCVRALDPNRQSRTEKGLIDAKIVANYAK